MRGAGCVGDISWSCQFCSQANLEGTSGGVDSSRVSRNVRTPSTEAPWGCPLGTSGSRYAGLGGRVTTGFVPSPGYGTGFASGDKAGVTGPSHWRAVTAEGLQVWAGRRCPAAGGPPGIQPRGRCPLEHLAPLSQDGRKEGRGGGARVGFSWARSGGIQGLPHIPLGQDSRLSISYKHRMLGSVVPDNKQHGMLGSIVPSHTGCWEVQSLGLGCWEV